MNFTNKVPLSDEMSCGILSNASGQIIIFHDQEIENELQWIEYDLLEKSFQLVFSCGSTQDLGITINKNTSQNIFSGQEVVVTHIENKKIMSTCTISLVTKDY